MGTTKETSSLSLPHSLHSSSSIRKGIEAVPFPSTNPPPPRVSQLLKLFGSQFSFRTKNGLSCQKVLPNGIPFQVRTLLITHLSHLGAEPNLLCSQIKQPFRKFTFSSSNGPTFQLGIQ